jgi:hypothetical protein
MESTEAQPLTPKPDGRTKPIPVVEFVEAVKASKSYNFSSSPTKRE